MYRYTAAVLLMISIFAFACGEQNYNIKVTYEERKENLVFYGENTAPIPQQHLLKFETLRGYTGEDEYYTVFKPFEKKEIVELKSTGKGDREFRISHRGYWGDPEMKPDYEKLYLFPFEHGKKWIVTQGYRGKATHHGESTYAVDFNMAEGSIITAARGGIVLEVVNNGLMAYPDPSYAELGNHVLIYHTDGTIAIYGHMKYKGNLVEAGDEVKAGDILGYSGNTGYSSGPHLHFAVFKPVYCGLMSIPTKFLNYDDKPIEIIEGEYYIGYNPAKGKIKSKLGKDMENSDFNSRRYKKTTDTLEIVTEEYDELVVFYCENGFDEKKIVEFGLKSVENLEFSKELPLKTEVPANTRFFLLFAKPQDGMKGYSYRYYYNFR